MAMQDVPDIANQRDLGTCLALLQKAGGLDDAKADKPAVTINLGAIYNPGLGAKGIGVLNEGDELPQSRLAT